METVRTRRRMNSGGDTLPSEPSSHVLVSEGARWALRGASPSYLRENLLHWGILQQELYFFSDTKDRIPTSVVQRKQLTKVIRICSCRGLDRAHPVLILATCPARLISFDLL